MEIFTWEVSNNTQVNTSFKPLEVEFGSYRQVAADGKNLPDDVVRVEVGPLEMPPPESPAPNPAQDCVDFLRRQAGLPFEWTPIRPLDQVAALWTCKGPIGVTRQGGFLVTITAEFRRFNVP